MNYGQGGGQYPPGYTQPGYPAQNPYGAPPANAYQPMPGPGMGMGAPPPQKSNVGLIIGIIAGVLGLGLILFLVFVFAIFRAAAPTSSTSTASTSDTTTSTGSDTTELSLPFLQNVARDASIGLPRMLDSETQEESVTALPGTLVYHNRLVHKTVGQLSVPVFTQILKPSIVSSDCANQAVRSQLLLKGVTLRYTYVDKFGAFITSIDITKHDCGI